MNKIDEEKEKNLTPRVIFAFPSLKNIPEMSCVVMETVK